MTEPPAAGIASPSPVVVRPPMAGRALRSALFGTVIALLLSVLTGKHFWSTWVYSVCIALCCWFPIDMGRTLLARWVHRDAPPGSAASRSAWPGWRWMTLVVIAGGMAGYSVGNMLGNWITGIQSPGLLDSRNLREAAALLMLALLPALGITYFFHSRGVIAAQEAQVQTAQRQAAEHQLKLLESQLEPHMLFNTLANLRVLIGIDPPRAQAMLDQLISFLRATLVASRSAEHTLASEFTRLADYLALMQVRMGERLQLRVDLPAGLAGLPVPPLLLQPLVENCIMHGLEPKVGGGRIDMSAAEEGGALVLRVRDTGVGLAGSAAPLGAGTRFGLLQVRERLATLYAGRASLDLVDAPLPEGGVLATIRLPLASDARRAPTSP